MRVPETDGLILAIAWILVLLFVLALPGCAGLGPPRPTEIAFAEDGRAVLTPEEHLPEPKEIEWSPTGRLYTIPEDAGFPWGVFFGPIVVAAIVAATAYMFGPTKPLAYPLIGHAGAEGVRSWQAAPPAARSVHLELVPSPSVLPDSAVREDILRRANAGARVAIVCNLVADAQQLARDLRRTASTPVGLFHSRFRFVDRQQIEQSLWSEQIAGARFDVGSADIGPVVQARAALAGYAQLH